MSLAFRLPENFKVIDLLAPAADAGGRTGQYITCRWAHKVFIVCHINQGNAAPVTLTLLQSKDVSGTGAKSTGINVPVWYCEDTSAATGSDTLTLLAPVAGGSQNSYTTGAATKNKYVVFEVDPSYLDQANGFKDITVQTSASNAANITEATAYVLQRTLGTATPTALVD